MNLGQRLIKGNYFPETLQDELRRLAEIAHELAFFFLSGNRQALDIEYLFRLKNGQFEPHERVAKRLWPYLTRVNLLHRKLRSTIDGTNDSKATKRGKKSNPDIQARIAFVCDLRSKGTRAYLKIAEALNTAEAFQIDPWLEEWNA